MVLLTTPDTPLGSPAPSFNLKGTDNHWYGLNDVKGPNGLVVMFICNHCPYVKAVLDQIIQDMSDLKQKGIGSVAIMSNDPTLYEEDSFSHMQSMATEKHFPFPYLLDETQEVAKSYGAICTPDFFGFNAELTLQYRGRLNDSGMQKNVDTTRDLYQAMCYISLHGIGKEPQFPSMGCSIKWKDT